MSDIASFDVTIPQPLIEEIVWTVGAPTGTTDHAALTNLQGGTTGQYYHLTSAQAAAVSSLGTASTRNTGTAENQIPLLGTSGSLTLGSGAALTTSGLRTYASGSTFAYHSATESNAHLTALGGGAVGVPLFKAATEVAARTALGYIILRETSPTQATTQNQWVSTNATTTLAAGIYEIDVFTDAIVSGSGAQAWQIAVSANLSETGNRYVGALIRSSDGVRVISANNNVVNLHFAQSGRNQSESYFGRLAITLSGSATVTLQVTNTAATGSVTTSKKTRLVVSNITNG